MAAFFSLFVLLPWRCAIPYRSRTNPAPIPVPVTFSPNPLKLTPINAFSPLPALFGWPTLQNQNVLNVKNQLPHFVTVKLVMQLEQCSKSTACRRINLAAQALSKQVHQRLSFLEYNQFYGYDQATVMRLLGFDSDNQKKIN